MDRVVDVEGLGIDTATSSLKRVIPDLRVVAVFPGVVIVERVGVGPSSRTASSSSPIELDLASLDDARDTAANFETLPPEPEVESELDFFSIGGGRIGGLDGFSFELELAFVPTASGLVCVGVSELDSTSFELGE